MEKLAGKSIMIWQLGSLAGGNIEKAVSDLIDMGIKRVSIKVAQNHWKYYKNTDDILVPFIRLCSGAGIYVFGWQWIDLINPVQEADRAIERIMSLHLDGWEIDAEVSCKGKYAEASKYVRHLADSFHDFPLGLCSFRFPSYHPTFPWNEFLDKSNYHAPQVYWNPPYPSYGHGPMPETTRSYKELMDKKNMPFVPVGRAYIGNGHPFPTAEEETVFMETALNLGSPGVSFWAFDFLYSHSGGAERALAIKNFSWSIKVTLEERVRLLEERMEALEDAMQIHVH